MPTHEKARELADAFEAVYPEELPQRLQWWCHVLGIDHLRFLRLMGMSGKEAKAKKSQDWDIILKDQRWRERGWWIEGKLHELLSLFDYDWQALSERLHHPLVSAEKEEPTRLTRPKGAVEPLRYTPNGEETELLLNLMTETGPESLSALLAYLTNSANDTARGS
ncbi:MAG: hypothetical protein JO112_15210 [Planctomycetes bacterium]|nr:hypothetical protein [Planctomycetota bacterium]